MFINKQEKVFSLRKSVGFMITSDLASLWGEFFAFAFLAGLYKEGDEAGPKLYPTNSSLKNKDFSNWMSNEAYSPKLGELIGRGLQERYAVLNRLSGVTSAEIRILEYFNDVMCGNPITYNRVSAKQILGVAQQRGLSDDMKVIAHYVAVMFGQSDFPEETILPFVYINCFGNIYLSAQFSVRVGTPSLVCSQRVDTRSTASPFFAFLSSFAESLTDTIALDSEEAVRNGIRPYGNLAEVLENYVFIGNPNPYFQPYKAASITAPKACSAANAMDRMGFKTSVLSGPSEIFYQQTLFGHISGARVIRGDLLVYIVNLMERKSDDILPVIPTSDSAVGCLLRGNYNFYSKFSTCRPVPTLEYALEALEADSKAPENEEDDDASPDKDSPDGLKQDDTEDKASSAEGPEQDPAADDGGYDPSVAPPSTPAKGPGLQENTIGPISFDKTGEGIEADLYRDAVVALNDRVQGDDSIGVDAETKDSLNFWVNMFLYKAAITATKDLISSLGLEDYIKSVSMKG